MIKTENLRKVYTTEEVETTALNNVDIHIEKGEFASIMGPSGCGKSTLLNVLGLIDTPTEGKYFFNGKEVAQLKEKDRTLIRKENIGFVFQSFNLIDELNVFENVELPLLYLGVPPAERKERITEVLNNVSMLHRKGHFPNQLSGGQQQRVAVARAIVGNPKVILADEPTGNLDSKNGDEIMNILTEFNNNGTTIVMVTHSPTYAEYGSKIINLFDGEVINKSKF